MAAACSNLYKNRINIRLGSDDRSMKMHDKILLLIVLHFAYYRYI